MKLKRWLSLLLGLLMLSIPLASCSSGKENGTQTGTKAQTKAESDGTGSGDPAETVDRNTVPDLPDNLDFHGTTIRILTRQNQNRWQEWGSNGKLAENADEIDQKVYYRNLDIMNQLNVNFDITHASVNDNQFNNQLLNAYLIDGSYDIISNKAYQVFDAELLSYYANLYDVTNLNLEKSYWNENYNSVADINGNLYAIVGDVNISVYMCAFCMFFNIPKCEEQGWSADDLFDIALNGDWDWEALSEKVKEANLVQDEVNKKMNYALYSHSWSHAYDGLIPSFGLELVSTDYYTGSHSIVSGTGYEKLENAAQKVHDLYQNKNVKLDQTGYNQGEYNLFDAGETLFSIEGVNDAQARKLSNLADEYGLLPLPKLEADGTTNYRTGVQDGHNVISVLKGRNYEAIGAVLELLSAYSYESVRPFYIDTLVKGQYLDNPKSQKVLDLILDGAGWDFAFVFSKYLPNSDGYAPHMALWRGGCGDGNVDFRYNKHKETWNSLLKKLDADKNFAKKGE